MSTFPCKVFPHAIDDGPGNMARDEAMLEFATAHPEAALLRTYGWREAALSLGYFQSFISAADDPRWRDVPIVRRPTGGGAILHDVELTYGLVLPASHPLARESVSLYRAVHQAIAGLLVDQGVPARRRGPVAWDSDFRKPFLCFLDRDPEDVVVGTDKIVGGAQRRRAGAILQHGSLLLARSQQAPELPGISDLASIFLDPRAWSGLVLERITKALGLVAAPCVWPKEIEERSRRIVDEVYCNDSWTRRR